MLKCTCVPELSQDLDERWDVLLTALGRKQPHRVSEFCNALLKRFMHMYVCIREQVIVSVAWHAVDK